MWVVERPADWDGETAVILAPGAGAGIVSPFMSFFLRDLCARGFLSVQFDFEYMRQGRRAPDPQPKLRARYREVIEGVQAEYRPRRLLVGGKSMGGRVSSYIAGEMDVVSGLVFLGYPLHPPGKPDQLRDEHLYDLAKPMLFLSGTKDSLAERGLLQRVVGRLGERATIVWFENGDHSLRAGRKDTTYLTRASDVLEGWIRLLPAVR